MSAPSDPRLALRPITRITAGVAERVEDAVAVERALEIRVDGRALAVTLCTPGDDRELTLGFLAGEGVITRRADALSVREVPARCADQPDAVEVALAPGVRLDWTRLERHFAATAACGLCGRDAHHRDSEPGDEDAVSYSQHTLLIFTSIQILSVRHSAVNVNRINL